MRPYTDFRNKRLGKRIDYDKAFGFQCVDLIKQYCEELLGMGKVPSIGNAKQVPNSAFFSGFEKIRGIKDLMQGDIIVRTRGTYGHIGIVDRIVAGKVLVLEQNGSGKNSGSGTGGNAIRVQAYSLSWYDLVLRNKRIFENLVLERKFVAEKIRKLQEEIRITNEYISTTRWMG